MKNSYTTPPISQIFPAETKNKIDILTLIYQNKEGIIIADILENIGLSRKTIYKYLKDINILALKHFNDEIIVLSYSKKYFFTKSKIDFFLLRAELIEEVPLTHLIFSFLRNQTISIPIFCSDYFITETSLKTHLKIYNTFLKPWGIFFRTRNDRLYIKGEETKIRYLMTSFLWRTYRGVKWPFNSISKEKLKETIQTLQSDPLAYTTIVKSEILLYLFAINILRAKSQNLIEIKKLPLYTNSLSSLKTNSLDKFQNSLSQNYNLPMEEIKYNILLLYIFPEFLIFKNNISETLERLCKTQPEAYWSIIHFLNFAKKRHQNWNPNSSLGNIFLSTLISSRIFVDIFKDIYFNIYELRLLYHAQNEFPNLLPSIEHTLKEENPEMPETFLKSLAFRYTQAYITTFPPQDFEPQISIQVVTDMPIYIEMLLINRLKALLSEKFNYKINSPSQSETVDLVIATGVVNASFNNSEIIYVYPHLSSDDTQNILSSCKQILFKKYQYKNLEK